MSCSVCIFLYIILSPRFTYSQPDLQGHTIKQKEKKNTQMHSHEDTHTRTQIEQTCSDGKIAINRKAGL